MIFLSFPSLEQWFSFHIIFKFLHQRTWISIYCHTERILIPFLSLKLWLEIIDEIRNFNTYNFISTFIDSSEIKYFTTRWANPFLIQGISSNIILFHLTSSFTIIANLIVISVRTFFSLIPFISNVTKWVRDRCYYGI